MVLVCLQGHLPLREHQVLLSPGPDEGSPSGCLWGSPMGGEVTHVPHIEEWVEPLMAAPAPVF